MLWGTSCAVRLIWQTDPDKTSPEQSPNSPVSFPCTTQQSDNRKQQGDAASRRVLTVLKGWICLESSQWKHNCCCFHTLVCFCISRSMSLYNHKRLEGQMSPSHSPRADESHVLLAGLCSVSMTLWSHRHPLTRPMSLSSLCWDISELIWFELENKEVSNKILAVP